MEHPQVSDAAVDGWSGSVADICKSGSNNYEFN